MIRGQRGDLVDPHALVTAWASSIRGPDHHRRDAAGGEQAHVGAPRDAGERRRAALRRDRGADARDPRVVRIGSPRRTPRPSRRSRRAAPRELTLLGLDIEDVILRDVPNPHAVILVDDSSGERMVLWDRDDGLSMRTNEYPVGLVGSARLVHVDDTDQAAAIAVARAARVAGVPVTSDIDRLTDLTEELVAAVSLPMFAEHVPAVLTGESDPERALRKIRRTHDGMLCVTLGPRGAMLLVGDTLYAEAAPVIDAVDTTGAGDVFRGGFAYAWLKGDAPDEILRFANAAAARSCTRIGAMKGVPTLSEALALLEHSRATS